MTWTNKDSDVIICDWSLSLLFCFRYPLGELWGSWGKKISTSKFRIPHMRSIFRISEYTRESMETEPDRCVKTCNRNHFSGITNHILEPKSWMLKDTYRIEIQGTVLNMFFGSSSKTLKRTRPPSKRRFTETNYPKRNAHFLWTTIYSLGRKKKSLFFLESWHT